MKPGLMIGLAGAALLASAGLAAAADGCACCKDMTADAPMACCDKPAPPTPAPDAPPVPQTPPAPGAGA